MFISTLAVAKSGGQSDSESRWGIGFGLELSESLYAGQDAKVAPLPLIHYEGERFFISGLTGGVYLARGESIRFECSFIVAQRWN